MHPRQRIEVKVILAVVKQQQLQRGSTAAMLYQLSYEASLEAGQERIRFIPHI